MELELRTPSGMRIEIHAGGRDRIMDGDGLELGLELWVGLELGFGIGLGKV